jgi:hypothetical protein
MGAGDTAVLRVTVLRVPRGVHLDTGAGDTAVLRVTVLRARRAVHPDTGEGDTTVLRVTVLRVPRAALPATVEDHTALPVPQVVVMGAQEEGTPPVGAAATRVVEGDTRPAGITEVG